MLLRSLHLVLQYHNFFFFLPCMHTESFYLNVHSENIVIKAFWCLSLFVFVWFYGHAGCCNQMFQINDTKLLHVLNSGVLPFFSDNARYLCYYFLVLVNVVLFNKRALSKK